MLASGSAEIHLMPDWTFFVQLGIFVIAIAAMNYFMIRPIQRILDKRKEYTTDMDERSAAIAARADDIEVLNARKLSDAMDEIQNRRAADVAHAQMDADKMIFETKAIAKKRIKDGEAEIESSRRSIAADIGRRASDVADDVVSKLTQ